MIEEKIKDRAWLKNFVQEKQKEGKVVGFTSGAFDLVHAGHIDYLQKAKELCDYLIVAINTDESIKRYKEMNRYNVVEIEPCGDYKLRVTFADGKCNIVAKIQIILYSTFDI